ncbi:MAG: DNA-directed RNA polymerase subunit alpha [Candidatus Nomurabacteria bacterium]|nr:DNA-directed RNA polymerase subunit alpha [Candidatus Nomurabacteria bacterium]
MTDQILLPSRLNIVEENDTKGTYEIEGLAPGYGYTLGNSLRRIILSSLQGVAITGLRIKGADHEFATIEGVSEDVIAIILNLKKVRLAMSTDEPQTVKLSVKGKKQVTAGDIEAKGSVEVMNPDQYIAELTDSKAELEIELTIEKGFGFVPREERGESKAGVGTILIDAVFTPIKRVSYEVENMRVGDRTDHNKLRLFIQTDGSLTPKQALEDSLMVMVRQIKAILDIEQLPEEIEMAESPSALLDKEGAKGLSESELSDILKTRIESLDLSTRTLNALADANIRTIGGLVRKTEDDILEIEGLGQKGLDEISKSLDSQNVSLKQA